MAKSKSKKNKKVSSSALKPFAKVLSKAKSSNAVVEVVECPPDFPNRFPNSIKKPNNSIDKRSSSLANNNDKRNQNQKSNTNNEEQNFNFTNASEEIYKLGMNTGKSEKQRLKEKEYKFLTGREMKRKGLPFREYLKSLNENKKQEKEEMEEIKRSGVVVGKSTGFKRKEKKPTFSVENKRNNKLFGPAPSIGYMKGGILRVKKT